MTFTDQWNLIKPIWRIFVLVLIMQIAGGITGIIVGEYDNTIVDLWYGGVLATIPGFLLGLVWHKLSKDSDSKSDLLPILFISFLCVMITVAVFFMPLEKMAMDLGAL